MLLTSEWETNFPNGQIRKLTFSPNLSWTKRAPRHPSWAVSPLPQQAPKGSSQHFNYGALHLPPDISVSYMSYLHTLFNSILLLSLSSSPLILLWTQFMRGVDAQNRPTTISSQSCSKTRRQWRTKNICGHLPDSIDWYCLKWNCFFSILHPTSFWWLGPRQRTWSIPKAPTNWKSGKSMGVLPFLVIQKTRAFFLFFLGQLVKRREREEKEP